MIVFTIFLGQTFALSASELIKERCPQFIEVMKMQEKNVNIEDVFKLMDEYFICHTFKDSNHLQNSFRMTLRKLKETNPNKTEALLTAYQKSAELIKKNYGTN